MPNVALLIGAGLIGALVAGLYLLYNDEGFAQHQHHGYENDSPRYDGPRVFNPRRPSNSRSNNGRGSHGSKSSETNYSERYDSPVGIITNGKRRRRKNDEDESCVICCEALSRAKCTTLKCEHEFHTICIQGWFKSVAENIVTCPTCRCKINNPTEILRSSA